MDPKCRAGLPAATTSAGDDLNVCIFQSLAAFLRETQGMAALERAARAADLLPGDFDGSSRSRWISLAQAERFLAEARSFFPDDASFAAACAHQYRASYGPLLLIARATTPWAAYELGCNRIMTGVLTRIGRFEARRQGSRYSIRYFGSRRESHLMCLPRQAQIAAMATLWGLPPLRVDHPRCIARGDECCEYLFNLVEPTRWLLAAVGLAAGLAAAAAAGMLGVSVNDPTLWGTLPLLGLLVGMGAEWRRASLANRQMAHEIQEGMVELTRQEAEARRELLAFQQRQRNWSRLLEDQVTERSERQQKVIDQMRSLEEQRIRALRALSHDLRGPLTVLSLSTDRLLERKGPSERDRSSLLQEMVNASSQMTKLLNRLLDSLSAESQALQLTARTIEVSPLVERLRQRLNALCYRRDIRTSTFSTREAPDAIEIDEVLLDRVVDNLLTNAAKYTEHGSILVEVSGSPGYLIIKVSDTGRGIDQEKIERVFVPGGSEAELRAPNSSGLGLSVVVQLLAQIGGKLEVMSKPNVGTTFWAHLPIRPSPQSAEPFKGRPDRPESRDPLQGVVFIRRATP